MGTLFMGFVLWGVHQIINGFTYFQSLSLSLPFSLLIVFAASVYFLYIQGI